MTNGNDSIAPEINGDSYTHTGAAEIGLTKREYFAAMAMQGMLANSYYPALGDAAAPADGEAFWQSLVKFRELSKPNNAGTMAGCLNLETGKLGKEISEFMAAKLENKSHAVQLKELLEAQAQIEAVKEHLIREYNELKDTPREPSLRIVG